MIMERFILQSVELIDKQPTCVPYREIAICTPCISTVPLAHVSIGSPLYSSTQYSEEQIDTHILKSFYFIDLSNFAYTGQNDVVKDNMTYQ